MTPEDTPRDSVPPAEPDSRTVRLGPQGQTAVPAPAPDRATVRFGRAGGTPPAPQPPPMPMPMPAPPLPPEGEAAAAESLIRFGPGVPDPQTARTMAVWSGAAPAGASASGPNARADRKLARYSLAGLVLLFGLAYLLWRFVFTTALAVDSAAVTVTTTGTACSATESFMATLHTNGGSGTVHYQWERSDGVTAGPFTQDVSSGSHQVQLPFIWKVTGQGSLQGTAVLRITSPGSSTASGSFNYSCQ